MGDLGSTINFKLADSMMQNNADNCIGDKDRHWREELLTSLVINDEQPSYKEEVNDNLGISKPSSDTETQELTSKIPQATSMKGNESTPSRERSKRQRR